MSKATRFNKGIVAVVGFVIGAIGRRYGIDSDVYSDAVAVATVLGVVGIGNSPKPEQAEVPYPDPA